MVAAVTAVGLGLRVMVETPITLMACLLFNSMTVEGGAVEDPETVEDGLFRMMTEAAEDAAAPPLIGDAGETVAEDAEEGLLRTMIEGEEVAAAMAEDVTDVADPVALDDVVVSADVLVEVALEEDVGIDEKGMVMVVVNWITSPQSSSSLSWLLVLVPLFDEPLTPPSTPASLNLLAAFSGVSHDKDVPSLFTSGKAKHSVPVEHGVTCHSD